MKFLFQTVTVISLLMAPAALSQSNPDFNVSLRLDFSSVEGLIDLREGRIASADRVAEMRGNQIAGATSALLARQPFSTQDFSRELQRFQNGTSSSFDIYGLNSTLAYFDQIKLLVEEIKKRQLDRRVIATIEQFFPPDASITTSIPVYFVALGHENASAYVRRIVWHGNTPQFVGDNEGELTIVMNLSRLPQYIQQIQLQFVDMMSTLAHETFHAAFGVYQSSSPVWQMIEQRPQPSWRLAELVQNEGIAYLISLQQHGSGQLSEQQLAAAKRTMSVLNSALAELSSASITPARARELIMNSNLSGEYEKNYGATAGLLMAFAIDARMGRTALTETIQNGVGDFFKKYQELAQQYGELPKFNDEIISNLEQ